MATDVKMPQMGESIAEGTITKWLKQEGDTVEADEPLFEISTDKVDAEIPSPTSGTLQEIVVGEGETVEVHTVVAKIDEGGEGSSDDDEEDSSSDGDEESKKSSEEDSDAQDESDDDSDEEDAGDGEKKDDEDEKKREEKKKATEEKAKRDEKSAKKKDSDGDDGEEESGASGATREERIKTKSSPLVRKIASEHDVDITEVEGSGVHGRVTKDDILQYIEERGSKPSKKKGEGEKKAPSTPKHEAPDVPVGAEDSVEPMSRMRQLIAEHMVQSKQTAAHVHSIHEVDMSEIDAIRAKHKKRFEEANGGAKLTYTVFIAKAVIDALRELPVVNASVSGDDIVYHGNVNLGMAVALDWGLIVPVIKGAQDLSMSGLAKSIADLAKRARNKQLKADEVEGSTFTITNYGAYGGLMGTPVINQPNSAILGVGTVEKRAVVIDDMIAIRPRMYVSLGYDHRLIDGAVAGQFLLNLKKRLENFDETAL